MKRDLQLKKTIGRVGLISAIYFSSISSGYTDTAPSQNELPQYLLNLGAALGYDISNSSPSPSPSPINSLIGNGSAVQGLQEANLTLILGAVFTKIIVDPSSPLNALNNLTDKIFSKNNSYTTPTADQISVSALIDQVPYQNNPVSQAIVNSLTTPDFSFCSIVAKDCPTGGATITAGGLQSICCNSPGLYQSVIGVNVLGTIPSPKDIANPVDSTVVMQLNSNSLTDPLVFSTTNNTQSTSSNGSPTPRTTHGLQATSQAQDAENFIRYASAAVAPIQQTDEETYKLYYNMYAPLLNTNSKMTLPELMNAMKAEKILGSYLVNMRVFAAQTSVGVANLYDILSKRTAQKSTTASTTTSQALNEYVMATRRLNNPYATTPEGSQWIDQINAASPATVQKEMAILLSEINYQLYLSRQQQERLLLTNTIMLFQLGHLVQLPPLQPPSQ